MHDIAQKQIFFLKLPELDLDPDLVVKYPDPDPAKRSGSGSGSGSATLKSVHRFPGNLRKAIYSFHVALNSCYTLHL
jgi:hypothetical protein